MKCNYILNIDIKELLLIIKKRYNILGVKNKNTIYTCTELGTKS